MNSQPYLIPPDFSDYVDYQRLLRVSSEISTDFFDHIDLLSNVYPKLNHTDLQFLRKALDFSMSVDYLHPGMSSKSYLKHPIRVANLITKYSECLSLNSLVIALLHNVLETSDVSCDTLELNFGYSIANSIEKLTVDRSQSSYKYKNNYYSNLNSLGTDTCIVKIFDKFDNLFMLSTNPRKDIREAYIHEIETFLLPLVDHYMPALSNYFHYLCQYSYSNPHIDKKYYVDLVKSGKIPI